MAWLQRWIMAQLQLCDGMVVLGQVVSAFTVQDRGKMGFRLLQGAWIRR